MTDRLGKTVEETGDKLIITQSKYYNKQNMSLFYKKWKKYNENSIDKKQNGLKYLKNDKSSTLPRTYAYNIYYYVSVYIYFAHRCLQFR